MCVYGRQCANVSSPSCVPYLCCPACWLCCGPTLFRSWTKCLDSSAGRWSSIRGCTTHCRPVSNLSSSASPYRCPQPPFYHYPFCALTLPTLFLLSLFLLTPFYLFLSILLCLMLPPSQSVFYKRKTGQAVVSPLFFVFYFALHWEESYDQGYSVRVCLSVCM